MTKKTIRNIIVNLIFFSYKLYKIKDRFLSLVNISIVFIHKFTMIRYYSNMNIQFCDEFIDSSIHVI